MSEPIPESVPTSLSRPSRRPTKKLRTSAASTNPLTSSASVALSNQAAVISSLMSDPDNPVSLPPPSTASAKPTYNPPEIVANVQGSSAGAGSGEFHVYKASRRREYERVRLMEEETEKEAADARWERQRQAQLDKDLKEREKKRAKRLRKNRNGGKKEEDQHTTKTGDAVDDRIQKNRKLSAGLKIPQRDSNHSRDNGEDIDANHAGEHESADTNGAQEQVGVIIHDDD